MLNRDGNVARLDFLMTFSPLVYNKDSRYTKENSLINSWNYLLVLDFISYIRAKGERQTEQLTHTSISSSGLGLTPEQHINNYDF